jgi:pyridoxal phosphate enzyme, yggS family
MSIQHQIHALHKVLPADAQLVAVSKFHPVEALREAYEAGQRIFGESRVQELVEKQQVMPQDIEWHFIGHLQQNKVKYIAPFVSLIHGVDSEKLLIEIDKQGRRFDRRVPCLLQLHVAREESKFGFTPNKAREYLTSGVWRDLSHVELRGIMCMASFTDEQQIIRQEFTIAHEFFNWAKHEFFANVPSFNIRSWGMSDDYPIALECGSNMVRVGTKIFGEREY